MATSRIRANAAFITRRHGPVRSDHAADGVLGTREKLPDRGKRSGTGVGAAEHLLTRVAQCSLVRRRGAVCFAVRAPYTVEREGVGMVKVTEPKKAPAHIENNSEVFWRTASICFVLIRMRNLVARREGFLIGPEPNRSFSSGSPVLATSSLMQVSYAGFTWAGRSAQNGA